MIVLAGVHFMAETAKILSPGKTVLIPDLRAGCSLASSITGADIRLLRERYPGVPVVSYVNTTAEVKAESDICCTSANAVAVVESLGVPRVIFLPDEYLGRYVAEQTAVEVILWRGHCEVHERFSAADLRAYRAGHQDLQILAHPECPPDVLAEADFVGSTGAMIQHVGTVRPRRVVMVTECSMSDNVAVEFPDVEFVRPCNLCPHMKRISPGQDPDLAADDGAPGGGRAAGRGAGAPGARAHARGGAAGRAMSRRAPHARALPALPAPPEIIEADVLVIGAGAAGLTAALGSVPRRVVVLTKTLLSAAGGGGASAWAQGVSPRRWETTTIRRCTPPTRWRPAPASTTCRSCGC